MTRRARLTGGLAASAMAIAGGVQCASPARASELAPVQISWEDSVVATLSLRDKAAQMVWPTVLGDYVSSDSPQWQRLSTYVADQHVGGFTISVGSPTEIAAKLNALQAMAPLPLLFGADLEFGAGYRARGGYFLPNAIDLGGAVVFPPEMAIGATRDTSLAYEQGRITAIEGRALGIHIAYSPILDVNNNPANPVINVRSYGESPQLAAAMGRAFVRGLQEHGMIATGKHFPGHGDTGTNSHLALPIVNVSRARLDSVELVPFRAAVQAGVGAIMSFHGSMPALDSSGVPGTLSPLVLTALLRGELGFTGLVISDAMDMRGVLDTYGAVEAVKRAVAAGADILIQPVDVAQAITAIVDGVREGRYPEARVAASARRVLAMKHRLGLERRRFVSIDSIRGDVGDSTHQSMARLAAERSITLVKDSLSQVPLTTAMRSKRVLSVTVTKRSDLGAGTTFVALLRAAIPTLRAEVVIGDDPGVNFARASAAADSADVVIISSYMAQSWDALTSVAPPDFTNFVAQLSARGAHPILVAFGNPYLLSEVPAVPAYLVAWGGFPVSQQAAARALLGQAPITGTLPISIPPSALFGAGLRRPIVRP